MFSIVSRCVYVCACVLRVCALPDVKVICCKIVELLGYQPSKTVFPYIMCSGCTNRT